MTRSIHTNRRHLEQAELFDYAQSEKHVAELERIRKELSKKRRIKRYVGRERATDATVGGCTDLGNLPINVCGESEFVHFAASPTDLRAVMSLLPIGTLDGVESIDLALGAEEQTERNDESPAGLDPDPLTGRLGYKELPGVFKGYCLGQYRPALNRIYVFAYVYDPVLPDREMWEFYLKLQMLSTFIHEVAHHFDLTVRVARDRWTGGNRKKVETYAEISQHKWVQDIVIPYLQKTYPEQWHALDSWIRLYGGATVPLSMLAGMPDMAAANGEMSFFTVPEALSHLAEDVAKGEPQEKTRLGFARELHYGTHYAKALEIIDTVLSEDPENLEGLTLKADIFEHQDRHEEALSVAELVVSVDWTIEDAWWVLLDAYRALERWPDLLAASTRMLEQFGDDLSDFRYLSILEHRAKAELELGELAGFRRDLTQLAQWQRASMKRRVAELRLEFETRYGEQA